MSNGSDRIGFPFGGYVSHEMRLQLDPRKDSEDKERRELIRRKIDLIEDARTLGDHLMEVWEL